MKLSTPIKAIVLFILFFGAGWASYTDLLLFTVPQVKDVSWLKCCLSEYFMNKILYSVVIGLLPVSFIILWKRAPVISTGRRLLSIFIVLLCISLLTFYRYKRIRAIAEEKIAYERTIPHYGRKATVQMGGADINAENYIFLGILTGSLVSYILLRRKNGLLLSHKFTVVQEE